MKKRYFYLLFKNEVNKEMKLYRKKLLKGISENILEAYYLRDTHPRSKSFGLPEYPGRHLHTALWSSPKQSAFGPHHDVAHGSKMHK